MCTAKNGKDSKHTTHIFIRVHFVKNSDNCKIHKIEWCEVGLQLEYVATNNFGGTYFNPRMNIAW